MVSIFVLYVMYAPVAVTAVGARTAMCVGNWGNTIDREWIRKPPTTAAFLRAGNHATHAGPRRARHDYRMVDVRCAWNGQTASDGMRLATEQIVCCRRVVARGGGTLNPLAHQAVQG
jgi:hypothetical protein